MKYVHSAGVVHRDLKPSNILINENCDLKICDFGLARIQDPQMTGYVSTRYYRAPEIMLTWQKYDVEVDIWSAGCIFAEMLEGKPLFPGKDHVNQFSIITELLGTPPDDVIQTICSENVSSELAPILHRIGAWANEYLSHQFRHYASSSLCRSASANPWRTSSEMPMPMVRDFNSHSPTLLSFGASVDKDLAVDLLERMLVFDPKKRVRAGEALAHQYLTPYHDPTDEPVAQEKFDWSFNDADLPVDTWKIMM